MNTKDFAFWGMILIIVCLSVYLFYYTKTESYKCISNPYKYSIDLLEKANGGTVQCTCIGPKGSSILTNKGFVQTVRTQNYLP